MIIIIGKCEGLERIIAQLARLEAGQRETNRLLRLIAKEEAPTQLASTGATVKVLSA